MQHHHVLALSLVSVVAAYSCGGRSELDALVGSSSGTSSSSGSMPSGGNGLGDSGALNDASGFAADAGALDAGTLQAYATGTDGPCVYGDLGNGVTCLDPSVYDDFTRTTFAGGFCATLSADECGNSQLFTRAFYMCCPGTCRPLGDGPGLCDSLSDNTQVTAAACAQNGYPPNPIVMPSPFAECDGGFTNFAASCCP